MVDEPVFNCCERAGLIPAWLAQVMTREMHGTPAYLGLANFAMLSGLWKSASPPYLTFFGTMLCAYANGLLSELAKGVGELSVMLANTRTWGDIPGVAVQQIVFSIIPNTLETAARY